MMQDRTTKTMRDRTTKAMRDRTTKTQAMGSIGTGCDDDGMEQLLVFSFGSEATTRIFVLAGFALLARPDRALQLLFLSFFSFLSAGHQGQWLCFSVGGIVIVGASPLPLLLSYRACCSIRATE
jgi:hypothetical protein